MVLAIVKGETSAAEAARRHGLTVAEMSRLWQSIEHEEAYLKAHENLTEARQD